MFTSREISITFSSVASPLADWPDADDKRNLAPVETSFLEGTDICEKQQSKIDAGQVLRSFDREFCFVHVTSNFRQMRRFDRSELDSPIAAPTGSIRRKVFFICWIVIVSTVEGNGTSMRNDVFRFPSQCDKPKKL
ncbi:hypothetical protein F2P81_014421 [Scophthalmus maximus]|uniref:Uncharacterized protein n=1 Tax=Scophthalmus maximus TaxID=52904 RepID=A0A6A4SP59_SCOMX|nr:hypothetical protein F2P81_014421 [Scophthalmus maximus]